MGQCCASCSSQNSDASSLLVEFDLPNSLSVKDDENSNNVHVVPLVKTTYNTFVELFLVNRILFDRRHKRDYKPSLEDILSHLPDNEEQQKYHDDLKNILWLLAKYRLKRYLSHYYHDSHCVGIEIIFKHIIMTEYIDEYTKHTTISIDCDDNINNIDNKESNNKDKNSEILTSDTQNMQSIEYQENIEKNKQSNDNNDTTIYRRLVFNQNDLVPKIFQYLETIDLNECSVVSFIWLFHAFSINSLYYLQLYKLTKWESKLEHNGTHLPLRVWQRFINARKIVYENSSIETTEPSKHFLTYFSSLQNIENVRCTFRNLSATDILFLEVLGQKSDKIKHFYALLSQSLSSDNNNSSRTFTDTLAKKPVLKLLNCKSVRLYRLQLPLILSNKCEQLSYSPKTINKAMCDALINKSDLTGIKKLTLKDIRISPIDRSKNGPVPDIDGYIKTKYKKHVILPQEKEEICKNLAKKMMNLKVLNITGPKEDTLILWKELNSMVVKNNGDVSVSFGVGYIDTRNQSKEEVLNYYLGMLTFVVNNKIKVTTGRFSMDEASLEVTKKAFETKEIFEKLEVLGLNGYASKHNGWSNFSNFYQYSFEKHYKVEDFKDEIDDGDCKKYLKDCDYCNYSEDMSVSLIETIHFSKLMCFDCYWTFAQTSDWQRMSNMIKCRFNLIDKLKNTIIQNKKKDQDQDKDENNGENENENESKIIEDNYNDNDILWNLNLNMNWPDVNSYNEESMIEMFGFINEMWININDVFIRKGKPISITVYIYRYHWKWQTSQSDKSRSAKREAQMKKMYEKYGKDEFLKIFGDMAVDKENDPLASSNHGLLKEKWRYKNYKMPIKHKYCKPLETPNIWCSFRKEDLKEGGDVCRIDFCVKNAEYQKENTRLRI